MLSRFKFYIIILSIYFSNIFCEEIAIITKNKGDVKYKQNSSNVFKNKVRSGLELYNNDLLVTGDDGFVMFAYLDDGSLVKVHKNSGVYVNGDIFNNSIQKQINIDDGFIKFDIKKQNDNEFKIVTPTSVASVKGTTFFLDASLDQDVFYGFEGIVEIMNLESNEISSLLESMKITSMQDGSLNIENISQQDLIYINQIQLDSGIDINNSDNESGDLDQQEDTYQIIIKLTDDNGEQKNLIIKFNDK